MASNAVVSPQWAVRPNTVAHPKPADSRPSLWLIVCLAVICVFVDLIADKTDEAERTEKRMLYMKQTFSLAQDAVAGCLASGLNGLLEHVTHFLQAAGIQVGLPINKVTPEGVVFVAQWVLLLLICYGVIAITFLLTTFLLRWLWWLLKVGVALACFGLILKDHSVDTETTAMRLVCLGSFCILMRIRPWKDRTTAAKIVHLEEQLKISERWRKRSITLFCCVIGFLCLVFFIVMSNSKAS